VVVKELFELLLQRRVTHIPILCSEHVLLGLRNAQKAVFVNTLGPAWLVNNARVYRVRSYIGRSDDPAAGKSYYRVEVVSVLSLVKASTQCDRVTSALIGEAIQRAG
jgi:hypothetical protein